jgi:hypothetical protein
MEGYKALYLPSMTHWKTPLIFLALSGLALIAASRALKTSGADAILSVKKKKKN